MIGSTTPPATSRTDQRKMRPRRRPMRGEPDVDAFVGRADAPGGLEQPVTRAPKTIESPPPRRDRRAS